jgi:hypothetical protein
MANRKPTFRNSLSYIFQDSLKILIVDILGILGIAAIRWVANIFAANKFLMNALEVIHVAFIIVVTSLVCLASIYRLCIMIKKSM